MDLNKQQMRPNSSNTINPNLQLNLASNHSSQNPPQRETGGRPLVFQTHHFVDPFVGLTLSKNWSPCYLNMACILLLFRANEMRKKLFMELEDGAELFYMANGKKVLTGKKMDTGIRCSCCEAVVSASKFEAHAGYSARKKPYRSIYTAGGISLQEVQNSLQCQVASAAAKSIKPITATTPSAQINISEQTSPKLKRHKRNGRDHDLFLSQARKDKALIDPLTSPGHDIVRINDAPLYRASSSEVLVEAPLGLPDGLFFQDSMTSAPESCFPSMLPSIDDVLEQDRLATSSAISRSAHIRKIITDLREELQDEKRKHEEQVKRLEDEKEETKIRAVDAEERARRLGQEVDASTKRIADLEQLVIEEREKSALLRIEKEELVVLRDQLIKEKEEAPKD